VRGAIADAGLRPADVDVVFADATGVPERDTAEARALVSVFGLRGRAGHRAQDPDRAAVRGRRPLDAATALLALRDGVIPPTGHREAPAAQHGIDLVQRARTGALRHALVLARGRGGFNSALLVSAP
jgi:act minimal PKS chain-length factor (CLF/KS beta)